MIDIVINIDWFTAHFEDRNKVVRIVKELFTHSTSMKTLLKKHGKIVLTILLNKYDQQCHLYQNKALNKKEHDSSFHKSTKTTNGNEIGEHGRDEFLAIIIGQLIRLYAKSRNMCSCF